MDDGWLIDEWLLSQRGVHPVNHHSSITSLPFDNPPAVLHNPPMSPWWALICFAVFFIGIAKSGFGSGVGLLIVPTTAMAMAHTPFGFEGALGLLLPLLIVGDLIAIWQYRHLFSMSIVKKLLPATVVGVVIGSLLLAWFHDHDRKIAESLIKTEIGLESVALVVLHFYRVWRGQRELYVPKPLHNHLVGGTAAISSTMAHAAGPIIALYLLPQKLDRKLFVGTCAIYFGILNNAKIPGYFFAGQMHWDLFYLSLKLLPLVFIGAAAGFWLNQRMTDRIFSNIVFSVTLVLGVYLMYDGISTLRMVR